MIGDWVNFLIDIEGGDTEYDPKNEIYQPMQVDSVSALNEVSSAFFGVKNDVAQLKPIPLTPEILEKNGFELDRGWHNDNDYFSPTHFKEDVDASLEISMDNGKIYWSISWDEYHIIEIKYVHELQHALRLCGIEKEIKL